MEEAAVADAIFDTGRLTRTAAKPRGSEREFERFFDAMWPRTRALAMRMGLGREDAEDVGLDAMAAAFDRWARVQAMPYRDGWLLKVTANMALRRLKKARPVRAPIVTQPVGIDDEVAGRITVNAVLAGMPRRQRQVVVLRYLADLSEVEVARLLRLDVGSVKKHASRARMALVGKMADLSGASDDGD